jgi:hypothetical protein
MIPDGGMYLHKGRIPEMINMNVNEEDLKKPLILIICLKNIA